MKDTYEFIHKNSHSTYNIPNLNLGAVGNYPPSICKSGHSKTSAIINEWISSKLPAVAEGSLMKESSLRTQAVQRERKTAHARNIQSFQWIRLVFYIEWESWVIWIFVKMIKYNTFSQLNKMCYTCLSLIAGTDTVHLMYPHLYFTNCTLNMHLI